MLVKAALVDAVEVEECFDDDDGTLNLVVVGEFKLGSSVVPCLVGGTNSVVVIKTVVATIVVI